ncbi:MAG: acyltransferase family protein [Oceanococcus sp.]
MSKQSAHWPEIDGIRGILSIIVVLGHINVALKVMALGHMHVWYWMPMDVFFVISGFLLGRIAMLNSGQPGFLKAYFARRILRIWPVYYAVVITVSLFVFVAACLGLEAAENAWTTVGFIKQLTFTQFAEYLVLSPRGDYLWALLHTWSVAMEEYFYALLPLFAFVMTRITAKTILLLVALAVVVGPVFRIVLGMDPWALPVRSHSFALGLLLACLTIWHERAEHPTLPVWAHWGVLLGVGISLVTAFIAPILPYHYVIDAHIYEVRWSIQSIAAASFGFFALAAIYTSNQEQQKGIAVLRIPVLVHLGKISYSTYLWHWPILAGLSFLSLHEHFSPTLASCIAGALILFIANLSYHYIELPCMNLKHLWAYRPAPIRVPSQPG